ncbi:hypothetical protein SDC9_89761 [bioreactor metagenome]|uniref:Uncharacterized protein n=1 Tax=bioreactor metagenome TaxID=1076179 RepID=A0A644ZRS5_9ZZZZ
MKFFGQIAEQLIDVFALRIACVEQRDGFFQYKADQVKSAALNQFYDLRAHRFIIFEQIVGRRDCIIPAFEIPQKRRGGFRAENTRNQLLHQTFGQNAVIEQLLNARPAARRRRFRGGDAIGGSFNAQQHIGAGSQISKHIVTGIILKRISDIIFKVCRNFNRNKAVEHRVVKRIHRVIERIGVHCHA